MISAILTLSFFCAPCNLAEGPPLRNLGLLNTGSVRPFVLRSWLCPEATQIAPYLVRILRVRIIGSAHSVCQTNR